MSIEELAALVKETRDAQKQYFRTRQQSDSRENLIQSKTLEARLDLAVFNILNPPQPEIEQKGLFDA